MVRELRGGAGGVLDALGGVLMSVLLLPLLKAKEAIPNKSDRNH